MTLPEFFIGLLQRVAPVGQDSIASLKVAVIEQYNRNINQSIMKTNKNQKIMAEMDKLANELDGLDPHTPEHAEKLSAFQKLDAQLERPTLVERMLTFFDKPMVKIGLMALFALASWWITKKLTQKKEEKDLDEVEPNGFQQQQGFYPPQPPYPYQPYGYGYGQQQPPRNR